MTSDAKIGLLLGLVFIFIIAFVINGLPRFRRATNGSELTTHMVNSQDTTLGIGDKEREVQNFIDWLQPSVEEPRPANETAQIPLEKDDQSVRYKINLPENILPYSPMMETAEEPERAPIELEEPAEDETDELTFVKLFDPPPPEPPKEESIEIPKLRPAKSLSPKVYVVSDGDNLAKIAKKIYGMEEGNKHANIMRIFELNSAVLTSPDELKIGQQLIIPPLLKSNPDQGLADKKETSSFFERVESIGRSILQSDQPQKTPSRSGETKNAPTGRQYVVKEGDNLWRIAVRQLGEGSRYPEIAKLNADILEDENSLPIGTTLKLPAQ